MNRKRLQFVVQLGLGLAFAGLGHALFTQRTLYPYDAYVFYALAIICFLLAWRTARYEKNAVWDALIDLWRGAGQAMAEAASEAWRGFRQALPHVSTRLLLFIAIGLNIVAAIIAWLLPGWSWLWGLAWGATIVALIVYVMPRSLWSRQRPVSALTSPITHTYVEPALHESRPNPIGLGIALGLVLLGQLMLLASNQPNASTSPFAGVLQLRLPGDQTLIFGGFGVLVIGAVLFAVFTRRTALSGYEPLTIVETHGAQQRLHWGWLLIALAGLAIWLMGLKSLSDGATGLGGALPWLAALGLISACWWQIDRRRGVRLSIHVERREALALIAALIVILAIFAWRLGDIPNSLWGDEGAFYTTARDIARGTITLDVFGLGTYNNPAFSALYQSLFVGLFGPNVTAWRLSSVVAAWLTALPLYFLARATLSKRTAWIALAFYAVSPYILTYARMGYDVALSLLPVATALALTWLAVKRDSRLYAFLAGCAAGFSFLVPLSARIAIVLVPLGLMWIWIMRCAGGKTIGRQLLASALGILIAAAPPIVVGLGRAPAIYLGKQFESSFNNAFYARDFYTDDELFDWYNPIMAGDQKLFYAPALYVPLIGRGVVRTALAFHLPALDQENYLLGTLSDPFGILYVLGLAWCLARLRRPGYALWAGWFIIGAVATSALSAFPPRAALMFPVAPALVTLSALGLTASVDVLASVFTSISDRVKQGVLIGVTMLLAVLGLRAYFSEMPQHFPPDLSNAIFWEAQALPRGSDVTLIQPDGLPANYVPWGLNEFDPGVNFHVLPKAELGSAAWPSLCPTGTCRFVYVAADRDGTLPYLQQAFGAREPKEIRGADGTAQLYVFAP